MLMQATPVSHDTKINATKESRINHLITFNSEAVFITPYYRSLRSIFFFIENNSNKISLCFTFLFQLLSCNCSCSKSPLTYGFTFKSLGFLLITVTACKTQFHKSTQLRTNTKKYQTSKERKQVNRRKQSLIVRFRRY